MTALGTIRNAGRLFATAIAAGFVAPVNAAVTYAQGNQVLKAERAKGSL